MPFFAWSEDFPVVFEYPNGDDAGEVAEIYEHLIEHRVIHPYFHGTTGIVEEASVVNFGLVRSVEVTRTRPDRPGPLIERTAAGDRSEMDVA